MNDRRHHEIVHRPDGSAWDEATMRAYLADIDRRAEPPTLVRLSLTDPEIVAFEATARGRRAA